MRVTWPLEAEAERPVGVEGTATPKAAVTDLLALIVSKQVREVPANEQSPPQPEKT